MLTLLLENKLFLAPLDSTKVRNVIDVGCGTGIWAMDFADAHPEAEIIGIDLSPTQPAWTPPNCRFEIDDIESTWTFPSNHFDFVHIRCLMGSISNWPRLYAQAYEHMAPGGWIQHLDMDIQFTSDDGTVGDGHIMSEWSKTFFEAGERMGKTFYVVDGMAENITRAGFRDVYQIWFKVPVGGWTKDKVRCITPHRLRIPMLISQRSADEASRPMELLLLLARLRRLGAFPAHQSHAVEVGRDPNLHRQIQERTKRSEEPCLLQDVSQAITNLWFMLMARTAVLCGPGSPRHDQHVNFG